MKNKRARKIVGYLLIAIVFLAIFGGIWYAFYLTYGDEGCWFVTKAVLCVALVSAVLSTLVIAGTTLASN